ncbi:single-stranded DNA-binding protein [Escherichia phage HZP2]|uniref:Single-stranded DNA-binding protein n=1 Tax=Escherichia phage HZP2 TaxID=2530019 RepID=A0A481V9B4_9CAUD|nr:single-stranded DNA-binding protein [Escherichia phage HZP2]QBI89965.1 single-stranded DNA-binding protein [Escherichia phage HZP2]
MIRVYEKFKWAKGERLQDGRFIANIEDSTGESWYDIMVKLDELGEDRWVIGTQQSGFVSWATNGSVNASALPVDGGDVIVIDSIPEDMEKDFRYWWWDGSQFFKQDNVKSEQKERTKEDIMADLLKLQEELKTL